MFEKLLKTLIYFWGIVLVIFIFKFLSTLVSGVFDLKLNGLLNIFYVEASETNVHAIKKSTSLDHLTLEKNYGMKIHNVESCPIFYPGTIERDTRCQKPNNYATSSHCTNGECTFTVEFGKSYPETVGICIKSGYDCNLKYFDVPEEPEVVGYITSFRITDALKEELGIASWEDDIRLEEARGFSTEGSFIEGEVYTFFYDYKPTSDSLYVNQTFKKEVRFNAK